jgi:hypothetical protein
MRVPLDECLTIDRNLVFQQKVTGLPFAVVILRARSNRLAEPRPLAPKILETPASIRPGDVVPAGG